MSSIEVNDKLVNILRQMETTPAEEVMKKNIEYLYSIKPIDLAAAEQKLFETGTSSREIEKKLPEHIRLLINPVAEMFQSLPNGHIVKKLVAEHRQIEYLLDEIGTLNEQLKQVTRLSAYSPEFKNLIHVASHVNASSNHADIEEKVLFDALEQAGLSVIPRILRAQHFEARAHSREFFDLAFYSYANLAHTVEKFEQIAAKLVPLKKRHILIEENLLYPIALEVIDETAWEELKDKCERVGFCCFHL